MRSENTGVISAATLIHLEQESGGRRPRHDMEGSGGVEYLWLQNRYKSAHKILSVI